MMKYILYVFDLLHDTTLARIILSLSLAYTVTENAYAARVVAEKRECATCHIAWIADFKRDDVYTLIPNDPRPMEKTGRQDVVSTERMCFSCHDGFVLDSRFLWQNGHNHPVGVKPSDKVQIPTEDGKMIFPLNDAGNVYCGTCHSAHGIEWGEKQSPLFLRARNIDSSLCLMCHVDRKGESAGRQNHPLMKEIPGETNGLLKVGSKFGNDNKVICQSCHRVHGAPEEKLLVKKNESSQLCTSCHTDKNTEQMPRGEEHYTHPVNIVPKSVSVPKQFENAGSKFGPKSELICETCHKVHHSRSKKLIVLEQGRLKEGLCVICHEDKRDVLKNGHNMLKTRKEEIADSEIAPILGACGACHNIHDGKGPRMWARYLESKGDRIAGLCLSCHKKGHLAEEFTVGTYSHPVGVLLPQNAKNAMDLPLYTSTGKRTSSTEYGRVSCPTCHDIHGPPSRSKHTSLFGASESSGKYLRIGDQDRLTLCKRCHEDKWSIVQTKHDIDKDGNSVAPNELGICGNCHLVHNGLGPRMWARNNIEKNTDPTSLCLSCHKEGAPAEDKTVGKHSHPVGVSIENAGIHKTEEGWVIGEGDEEKIITPTFPLYDDKGINQKDGDLVGCGSCHDPHRWDATTNNESLHPVKKDEEGDSSNSFLRIAASPDGQLCTTCHQSKATIRATDHDMAVTVPDTSNLLSETPKQSGVCGQCHSVHNAGQDLMLWARQPGPGRDAVEKLCRSCHIDGEIAQAKAPKKAHHPSYVRAWSSELRKSIDPDLKDIPMFSSSGERAKVGFISCPTCHNAHQWQADKADAGIGTNEEGSVLNSFLRLQSTENFICADCHGLDSLFRYKYFHGIGRETR